MVNSGKRSENRRRGSLNPILTLLSFVNVHWRLRIFRFSSKRTMSRIENSQKIHWIEILSVNNSEDQTKYNEALAYVRQNYMKFYNDDSFLSLESEAISEILKSDDLNIENEEVVFDSVRRWLDFKHLNLHTHLKPMLSTVRLPLLPVKYLLDEVEPYVNPIPNCRDMFLDVLRYHLGQRETNTTVRKYQKLSTETNKKTLNCKITKKSDIKLLSIGSDNLNAANVIEIYDNVLNEWIKPKSLAIYRRNFSVASIDDKIMLIGGTRFSNKDTEPLNLVQSLDLSTGFLSTETSLNDERQYAAAVVIGKEKSSFLYVLGGRGLEDDLDSVERWDPFSRTWIRMPHMPYKRTGSASAVLNNKIYILGGKIDSTYTNTMEAYNLEEGKWETKASMKNAKAHFGVAVFKEFLYAVAGSKGYLLRTNTVEKYDPHNDSWITLANIMATGNVGISSLGNRLICAGGKDSQSVLEYDEQNDKWLILNDLHVPRAGYLLELPKKMKDLEFDWDDQTTSSRKLLMVGNQKHNICTTACTLEVYDDRNNQWTRLSDMNINKINYSVAYVNENVLIIGGTSSVQLCNTASQNYQLNSVESLNLQTGEISRIAPLNVRRQHSAAVVIELKELTCVYVLGGVRNGKLLKSVERWDSFSRTWFYMTPMTVPRTGHGAVLLQGKIYVIGGIIGNNYQKTVEAYDLENDCWIPKASMNNINAYFGVTTFKNCIYVAGGNRDSRTPINSVERYDPVRNVWTTIANISSTGPVGISGLGNKLICAGGTTSNIVEEYDEASKQWRILNSMSKQNIGFLVELRPNVDSYWFKWTNIQRSSNKLVYVGSWELKTANVIETFDIIENKWTKHKDLPLVKRRYGVGIIDNKLLIVGGCIEDGKKLSTVDAIDLSTGTMMSLPPLKEARQHPPTVVVQEGNKEILYVIGGWGNGDILLSSVEKWDPATNEWTEGVPRTNKYVGHGVVFLNGYIYAVGGRIGKSYLNVVESFNVKSEIWETKASMKNTNAYFGIATFKDHIYVAGGATQYQKPATIVERYDPSENTWTTLANISTNRLVGLCSIGDRLICAGGNKNTVQEYDVSKNQWVSLPSMHVARHGFLLELPENAKLFGYGQV